MIGSTRPTGPRMATNEVERMRTASPEVWMVLGNAADGGDLGRTLLEAAQRIGGRLTFQDSLLDGRLYRLTFQRAAAASAGPGRAPGDNRHQERRPYLGDQPAQRRSPRHGCRGKPDRHPRPNHEDPQLHQVGGNEHERQQLVRKRILGNQRQGEEQPSLRSAPANCGQEQEPAERTQDGRPEMLALLVEGRPPVQRPRWWKREGQGENAQSPDDGRT